MSFHVSCTYTYAAFSSVSSHTREDEYCFRLFFLFFFQVMHVCACIKSFGAVGPVRLIPFPDAWFHYRRQKRVSAVRRSKILIGPPSRIAVGGRVLSSESRFKVNPRIRLMEITSPKLQKSVS